ncbi:RNA polymerase subunit sigma-70 [Nonlabens dokdonensis]|uniref:RNA polymerase subunit sigma-70 n=1 Tax=Nonlabens dokdonensis TaxID=328515 RepID=A0A1Z8AW79_9FLAO|nr:sigma-70 family RNA polymerase sigma factor [Nonlabens dokdonensis]OUS14468.1 RNA polymerase subunit sigma-70 [Nonlabens dokdonensis]
MIYKEVINSCKKNDRKAQRELYETISPKLYASCLRYAPNEAEAKDILQDSFIIIFKKIDQFNFTGSFEGWCKRITVNTALQRYRSTKVYELVNEDQIKDEESIEIEEYNDVPLDRLLQMIQNLPDRYRLVFSMYALDGYSHNEIAEMMNISVGTSKSNLARSRKHLQEMVKTWREVNNSTAS